MSISKDLQGLWEIHKPKDEKYYLHVRKVSSDLSPLSYWFVVDEKDPDYAEAINKMWYDEKYHRTEMSINSKDLNSIQWPTFVESGKTIYINVLPSGNYYVEDS